MFWKYETWTLSILKIPATQKKKENFRKFSLLVGGEWACSLRAIPRISCDFAFDKQWIWNPCSLFFRVFAKLAFQRFLMDSFHLKNGIRFRSNTFCSENHNATNTTQIASKNLQVSGSKQNQLRPVFHSSRMFSTIWIWESIMILIIRFSWQSSNF